MVAEFANFTNHYKLVAVGDFEGAERLLTANDSH